MARSCDRSNFIVTIFQKQTLQTKLGTEPKEAGIVPEKPQSQLQAEAVACSSNGRRGGIGHRRAEDISSRPEILTNPKKTKSLSQQPTHQEFSLVFVVHNDNAVLVAERFGGF